MRWKAVAWISAVDLFGRQHLMLKAMLPTALQGALKAVVPSGSGGCNVQPTRLKQQPLRSNLWAMSSPAAFMCAGPGKNPNQCSFKCLAFDCQRQGILAAERCSSKLPTAGYHQTMERNMGRLPAWMLPLPGNPSTQRPPPPSSLEDTRADAAV